MAPAHEAAALSPSDEPVTGVWRARLAESVWLGALLFIPLTFDPSANQAFELPKLLLLAVLALVSVVLAGVGLVQERHRPLNTSLALAALVWVLLVAIATLRSTDLAESYWGSYDRRSGLLLTLSLVGIGAGPWMYLRSGRQLERLVVVVMLGCAPALLYGLAQRAGLDWIGWIGRPLGVTSTLGSSTALGGYIAIAASITLALVISTLRSDSPITMVLWRGLAVSLLSIQLVVLLLTSVRAALAGCLIGLVGTILLMGAARGKRPGRREIAGVLVALVLMGVGVTALSVFRGASADIDRATLPRADTSLTERGDLWRSSLRYFENTLRSNPMDALLGAGPDRQASRLEPWLEPRLPARLSTTQFDRIHLSLADVVVTVGVLGAISIGILMVLGIVTGIRTARTADWRTQALLAGLCSGLTAFLAESSVSFPSITSLTLVTIFLGAMGGMSRAESRGDKLFRTRVVGVGATIVIGLSLLASLPVLAQELRADHSFQRALAYAANEELTVAIASAETALSQAPHRPIYAAELVELLLQRAESAPRDESARPDVLDREPRVIDLLERAVNVSGQSDSEQPFLLTLRARALDELLDARGVEWGSRDSALAVAERAAQLAPWRVELKDLAARLALRNGDPGTALRLYESAAALDPVQSQRIAEMGHAYRMLGDRAQAKRLYDEALRREEQSAEAWWGLAQLQMERGNWTDAFSPAVQAARYSMRDWRFRRDLGYVYYELGAMNAARQELRTALRLAPSWHWESLRAQVDAIPNER